MSRLSLAFTLAASTLACGGSTPTLPTAVVAPTPTRTFTVSGVISTQTPTRLTPLEGVQIFMDGQRAITDGEGAYSLSNVKPNPFGNSVRATKAGYGTETTNVTIKDDTRVDMQLVRTAIFALTGVVSESTPFGRVPVEGVQVDVYSMPCNQRGTGCVGFGAPIEIHQTATTDKNGIYRFAGLYPGQYNFIWVEKSGFEDPFPAHLPENSEGGQAITIDGDSRFDIQLVRR